MQRLELKRMDLVYPDLSYQIIGILFDVWTNVGHSHKEIFYQKAVARGLRIAGLKFGEQLPAKIQYRGESLGKYFFDFLIEDKVILEIKVREYFSRNDINQLYSYLRSKNYKLGLIAHFTRTGVKVKRVVNIA